MGLVLRGRCEGDVPGQIQDGSKTEQMSFLTRVGLFISVITDADRQHTIGQIGPGLKSGARD